mmetsp:Transcript_6985/g.11670  ORF Transcript_6985/g.11670 Transcript_6985/m.11670 type:complete len:460 (+) Transcript_6985:2358-3737(+)|eukprot:CAMPEP_0114414362 /NCGR_PEP_ID=MMETSP0103-20121206/1348_1 /TAXON_ID=37642 ORGANISM="Paraphysomonas imperforata, Strain PA2" /NCGR_SAMPLE_ID=MMETSP0103 /ASSEMBLY_ACC=CAM_ASM_000201 /LENGTH=459 /DNA_ID=CAMNT_0001582499 /DNA_START=143 /DNA_END=1522 /DNA_ORIENTATION=-
MNLVIAELFLLWNLCVLVEGGGASTDDSFKATMKFCWESGCFTNHHGHHHKFISCSTRVKYIGPTNCRHGYPPSINISHYDFLYDFNSMYPYESSHFEGLAWAGPERVQFILHAHMHQPKRIATVCPQTQYRWTRGIVWALQNMGIEVDEFTYSDKQRKEKDAIPWPHESDKWIGLSQGCRAICKPCFRDLTLAAYDVHAPAGSVKHIMGTHCRDIDTNIKKNISDLPFSTVVTLKRDPVVHSVMRKSDYEIKQDIDCTHVLLISRLDAKRAMVYAPTESTPILPNGKPQLTIDHRINDVFRERFGPEKVKVYYGNSTTEELLDMFSNACAIVGPGGAAFGNVLFAQPYTYILEIYTYIPSIKSGSRSNIVVRFESNIEAGLGTGVTWDVFGAGLENLTPPFPHGLTNISRDLMEKGNHHMFVRIGYESNFLFTMQDYHNMVNATCKNVKHLSAHMAAC